MREKIDFLNVKHQKLQGVLMGLILLTAVFVCGCSSSDAEYVRPDDPYFQAEDTEAGKMEEVSADFESVTAVVEEFSNMMNLDDQPLVKSWHTEASEELYYLQMIMDEEVFRDIYQNQNNDEVRQLWKDNMRDPLIDLTTKYNEIFLQYGFDTSVCAEIVNPFNTDKAILSIMDGVVLYDIVSE